MSFFRRLCFVSLAFVSVCSTAQTVGVPARRLVTQPVADEKRMSLRGNIHPLVSRSTDQGAVPDGATIGRMLMTLRRSEEQEAALHTLLEQQQDQNSSNYHKWLTPEEFGLRFGPSNDDIAVLTAWLESHGFSGIEVSKGRTTVEFSGTAGAVRQAFSAPLHRFQYQGRQRTANIAEPQVPAALGALVSGIDSLNNFPRRTYSKTYGVYRRDPTTGRLTPNAATASPAYTFTSKSGKNLGLTPYDFAKVYNVKPLWDSSIDGTGQSIAIVGESDLNPADFVNFRKLFGLPLGNTSGPTGTQYLNIIHNGPNPGIQDDEVEGNLDTQWAGGVAKGATINYVSSLGTEATAGIDLSALYIVNNNLSPVISESWGICEFYAGAGGNQFYSALWQQAAAQGITVLVSSGDSGSAGCDQHDDYATTGLTVNAIASTPYTTAVGGTDFLTLFGDNGSFGTTNDSTTKASVSGYIPETTWNNSCTNQQLIGTTIFPGLSTSEAICNTAAAKTTYGLVNTVAAGGGKSNCTSPTGSNVSTCAGGYARPSWQSGAGVPSDTTRGLPDVSLFASNGFSGAFYMICQADLLTDGKGCNIDSPYSDVIGIGGTSASSPAMAGIMALVNQKTGARLGNANYNLYALFNRQASAGTACNAASIPSASCTFNDVTTGTVSMPCLKGTRNCTTTNAGNTYGVLSGYTSAAGYDLATGLGSVNAANLANNWSSVSYASTTTTLTLSPTSTQHGANVTASVRVTSTSGTPTGDVTVNGATANGSIGRGTLSSGSFGASTNTLPGGTYQVKAHYGGDATHAQSDSAPVSITVTPEDSKTTASALFYNLTNGATSTAVSAFYGQFLELVRFDVAAKTCATATPCNGVPTGTVTVRNNGSAYNPASLGLNSTGLAEIQTIDLTPGTYSFSGSYSGDASFNASSSAAAGFTITKAPTTTSFTTAPASAAAGATVTYVVRVPSASYGNILQTGTVTLTTGSTTLGTATVTGTYDTTTGVNFATATVNATAPTTAGSYPVVATYSGDGNYLGSASAAATLTVTGGTAAAGFSLTSTPNTITVSRGASGTSSIVIVPDTGFTGTVSLSCAISSAPTGAVCSLSPTLVTASGTSTLTVTTVRGSAITGTFAGGLVAGGAMLGCLLWFARPGRRRVAHLLSVLILGGILAALTGCGSGGSASTAPSVPGTPTGSYIVTVTGVSGSITKTTTITLTVK